jgi:hypothetical protein
VGALEKESTAVDTQDAIGAAQRGFVPAHAAGDPGAAAAMSRDEIDVRLPLVIGVTGHRDLRSDARQAIAGQVRNILVEIKNSYPATPIILLSPLAEGADRLVAEVALEGAIGAKLMAPLPMPREIYARDFATAASRAEFDRLLAAAKQSLEMPAPSGIGAAQLQNDPRARQDQYLAVGEFVARNCQLLVALWDGKPGQRGGTGEVVRLKLTGFHGEAPPGIDSVPLVARGPVFHIAVPRERDGSTHVEVKGAWKYPEGVDYEPAEAHDFYHHRIFKPLDDYNREAIARAAEEKPAMERAAADLMPDGAVAGALARGFVTMLRHYATADALANRYGAGTNRTLCRLSILAFAAALSFDLAIHILGAENMVVLGTLCLFGLPVLTGVAMLMYRRARRADYQNRYQDYRGLAEGLRVQYFWRLAGADECVADHYLGRHRHELQWIRNACRSSLVAANCPLGGGADEAAQVIVDGWIDSQARYFEHAAGSQQRKLKHFERRIQFCFWLGFAIVLVLSMWSALLAVQQEFRPALLARVHEPAAIVHGVLLLTITMSAVIAALTHNYAEKLALATQVRMYNRMHRLYRRYGDKLRTARGPTLARGLFELGREALVENGEWVMAHRERPLEVPHH